MLAKFLLLFSQGFHNLLKLVDGVPGCVFVFCHVTDSASEMHSDN